MGRRCRSAASALGCAAACLACGPAHDPADAAALGSCPGVERRPGAGPRSLVLVINDTTRLDLLNRAYDRGIERFDRALGDLLDHTPRASGVVEVAQILEAALSASVPARSSPGPETVPLEPDVERRLRALGYAPAD